MTETNRSGISATESSGAGYYGQPVIHRPHWKWLVTLYFYFGGISGAAAVIAGFARLHGGASGARTARSATYVSMLALAPCPVLLILDLGRPRRFLNMLRVFRASSPMSVGSWGLAIFGMVNGLVTGIEIAIHLRALTGRDPNRLQRWLGLGMSLAQATCGFFVAGYTGVLLAATAVPLWSKRPALLGPLFLASAMTSGAAAVATVTTALPDQREATNSLHRLETVASVAEGALLVLWVAALGSTASSISAGRLGALMRHGAAGVGIVLPLGLLAASHTLPSRFRRATGTAASLLSLAGVFALRFAVVEGGRRSADDPHATFDMTG